MTENQRWWAWWWVIMIVVMGFNLVQIANRRSECETAGGVQISRYCVDQSVVIQVTGAVK